MKRIAIMIVTMFLTMSLRTTVGYTADITSEQIADPVYIHSNAYHSTDEVYNACEIETAIGYMADITSEQTADTVYVHINAYHSTDEIYNCCEIELTYDADMLRFDSRRSALGNLAYWDINGRLILIDFGEDKSLGESVYVLAFEAIGTGEAEIRLCRAAFSTSEKSASENIEPIVNKPNSIKNWVNNSRVDSHDLGNRTNRKEVN